MRVAHGRVGGRLPLDRPATSAGTIMIPHERLMALEGQLGAALAGVQDLLGTSRSCLASMAEQSVHASPGDHDAAHGSTMIDAPQTAPRALLLSAAELAVLLGCNPRTLRRWRQQRGFPRPITMGKSRRWKRRDIEGWLGERSR